MKYLFFLLLTFSASLTGYLPHGHYFVVWNVGQGQWATLIHPQRCLHFDMGGEFFPWKTLATHCQTKPNIVFLSHWDWDHIGALAQLKKNHALSQVCIALVPLGTSTRRKMQLINSWPRCEKSAINSSIKIWQPQKTATSNEQSQVLLAQHILLPGDSPQSQEKIWAQRPWIKNTQGLLLGHHGSQSSTSELLLKAIPHAQWGISSARWARYKHPHSAVEARLRKARIPLLRTEDWGHLWMEQKITD